jgi:quinolinate synthase
MDKTALLEYVKKLKIDKNAIILGHNYMEYWVQLASDFVGDSYELAIKASKSNADIIVFAGVMFMAEQAKAFNLDKKVLIPDLNAGCSLSDSLDAKVVEKYKKEFPDIPIVLYINTSIYAKAFADYIVTSSTAVTLIKNLPYDAVIFGPDRNLANYVQRRTGKKIIKIPEDGKCIVHANYTRQMVEFARKKYPNAILMAHPEAPQEILDLADFIGSTSQMIKFAQESPYNEFIVATELGMINSLMLKVKGKKFYPLVTLETCACARCPYMNLITLEKVKESLKEEIFEIKVPEEIAEKAKIAFQNTVKFLERISPEVSKRAFKDAE